VNESADQTGNDVVGDSVEETGSESATSWAKVDAAVIDALDADGRAPVIIALNVEPGTPPDPPVDTEAIAAATERVLAALDESGFTVRVTFAAIPAVAGFVTDRSAIEVLNAHPDVVAVNFDGAGGLHGG
jgi:hypothetical protein